MYRNAVYNSRNQTVHLFTWDSSGNRVSTTASLSPYLYIEDPRGEKTTIYGTKAKKRIFRTTYDKNKFIADSGIRRIYENFPAVQQYLLDVFWTENEKPEFSQYPLKTMFIDIETFSPEKFPDVDDPTHTINVITCYDSFSKKFYTFGLKPYTTTRSDVVYTHCRDEKTLLTKFVDFFKKDYPDVLSGWNCLEENQHIWLEDRIVKIKDLSNNYENKPLKKHGICIKNFMNTGLKEEYIVENEHGTKILCSKNHRFMMYKRKKTSYKNYNTLTKDLIEVSVEDIEKDQDQYDFYTVSYLSKNQNKDLTYKDVVEIFDQLSQFVVKEDAESFIFNLTPTKRQCDNFIVYKDESISQEVLQLLGFIFTDGSYSKTEKVYRITSKYSDLISEYTNAFAIEHNKTLKPFTECNTTFKGKQYTSYSKQFGTNNKIGLMHRAIYDCSDKKKPNIELLSRLSHKQFKAFFSGLIDGDGWVERCSINLCNYDCKKYNFLEDLQELLLWNGVQTRVHEKYISINCNTINKEFITSLNIRHSYRKQKIQSCCYKELKDTPSKNIQWRYSGSDEFVVRVLPVKKTGRTVQMYDITTATNTFLCKGVHTHNCDGFDIPYIINRCDRILGEEKKNELSPLRNIYFRAFKGKFGRDQKRYHIDGISCIDFLDIYRRFCLKLRESYKLDAIGEIELGERKVDYGDMDLATLSVKDWQTFVDYNIQDVNLLVRLEEKLQYISLLRMLAYVGLTTLESAMGTISIINGALAIKARKNNEILSTFVRKEGSGKNPGAYVAEPKTGFKKNIVSFDANSLYPNVMISLNLSPETKIGRVEKTQDGNIAVYHVSGKMIELTPQKFAQYMQAEQCALTKAGFLFTQKKKGIIPEFLDYYYSERKKTQKKLKELKEEVVIIDKELKQIDEQDKERQLLKEREQKRVEIERYNTLQIVQKVLLNSVYGYMGNKQAPIGDDDIASSVTLTGQAVIKEAGRLVQQHLKEEYGVSDKYVLEDSWIYSDTDSYSPDTLISTNTGIYDAETLWNMHASDKSTVTTFGHEIQRVEDLEVVSYDKSDEKVKLRKVRNLIRHKVTKEKFKITAGGNSICMTGDHGCIVIRDNKLVRVSAKDIKQGDKMMVRRSKQ